MKSDKTIFKYIETVICVGKEHGSYEYIILVANNVLD